jgi:hypothetical protein
LRPGGVLVVEDWNRRSLLARASGRRWHVIAPPSVAWLHTRAALELFVARAGAQTVAFEPAAKWVSVGLVGSLLDSPSQRSLVARAGRLVRSLPAGAGVPYKLGDLITMVARRPDDQPPLVL